MSTYCVKCREKIRKMQIQRFLKQNIRLILQSKCTVCGIKK